MMTHSAVNKPTFLCNLAKQHGVVLVISLLMLLLVTLLAVSAMQTNSLQEKMAGNHEERHKSLQAAEAAALFAWADLNSTPVLNTKNFIENKAQNGLYDLRPANTDPDPDTKIVADWNEFRSSPDAWPWGEAPDIAIMPNKIAAGDPMKLATAPQYAIGMYAPILRKGTEGRKCIPFSIIGAGQGSQPTSRSYVMLQVIPKSGCFRDPVN